MDDSEIRKLLYSKQWFAFLPGEDCPIDAVMRTVYDFTGSIENNKTFKLVPFCNKNVILLKKAPKFNEFLKTLNIDMDLVNSKTVVMVELLNGTFNFFTSKPKNYKPSVDGILSRIQKAQEIYSEREKENLTMYR